MLLLLLVLYYSVILLYLPRRPLILLFFFFNDTPPTEISPLSLHDALPLSDQDRRWMLFLGAPLLLGVLAALGFALRLDGSRRPGRVVVTPSPSVGADLFIDGQPEPSRRDRKSTRLNSSHT